MIFIERRTCSTVTAKIKQSDFYFDLSLKEERAIVQRAVHDLPLKLNLQTWEIKQSDGDFVSCKANYM